VFLSPITKFNKTTVCYNCTPNFRYLSWREAWDELMYKPWTSLIHATVLSCSTESKGVVTFLVFLNFEEYDGVRKIKFEKISPPRPTQSIMYVPVQVSRSQKCTLLRPIRHRDLWNCNQRKIHCIFLWNLQFIEVFANEFPVFGIYSIFGDVSEPTNFWFFWIARFKNNHTCDPLFLIMYA